MSKEFPLTVQFSAADGGSLDAGILRGVIVAEIGTATGHFAYVDKANSVMGVGSVDDAANFPGFAKRLPLCMDAKSLETVVIAAGLAKRIKAREDHSDAIEARAGYVANFRIESGKAVCDLTTFDAYKNRALFLETAAQTPELIGLSGDFKFTAEVKSDCALMRVTRVNAVDIVDRGALTHAGLFRAKGVDIPAQAKPEHTTMAKAKMDADEDAPDMDAFKTMCDSVASYAAKHADFKTKLDDCMSSIAPVTVPTPPGAPAPVKSDANVNPEAKLALKKELTDELSVQLKEIVATEMKAAGVEFQKQMSALGLKPAAVPTPPPADEKKTADAPTEFLALRASVAKERNISPTEAARAMMKEKPEVYEAYQIKLGVIKPKAA